MFSAQISALQQITAASPGWRWGDRSNIKIREYLRVIGCHIFDTMCALCQVDTFAKYLPFRCRFWIDVSVPRQGDRDRRQTYGGPIKHQNL